jgi:hypothetical protein
MTCTGRWGRDVSGGMTGRFANSCMRQDMGGHGVLGHRGGACARAGKHGLGTRGGDGLRGSEPRKGRAAQLCGMGHRWRRRQVGQGRSAEQGERERATGLLCLFSSFFSSYYLTSNF